MFSRAVHIGHGFQRRGHTLEGSLEQILERGNSPMVAARLCAENPDVLSPKLESLLREMVAQGLKL
jgi:hypothetical protein